MSTEQAGGPQRVSQSSAATGAVFLSYASQDAAAAKRIATALRAAGIEVWFDQSELRGGDAWDRQIRKQIKTCALFIPVISHATHDRREGYFRLEWKLAVDRSHLMDAELAFLMPVVIDDTRDDDERVPERFREVQWTRLPGGEASSGFVDRVGRLLLPQSSAAPDLASTAGSAVSRAPRGLIHRRRSVLYGAIALVAALALGYYAIERLMGRKPLVHVAASIAVLPLANESGEASQQYFSDGISEDLITALGRFPGLKVIGRTSSFQFRDSKEDSRAIGAKLEVAHLLEGSVRKSGEMIRVSAELIDTADGSMQWSERYDRPYKDLFALQDEITRAVAGALRAKLLPDEHATAQSERPPGGSLEAYNALLQGRFYHSRVTEADWHKAIESYRHAVELDPRYAAAWSELSSTWTDLAAGYLAGAPMREAYAQAREAADRALTLSPDLAAAHVARGDLLEVADFDWHGADAEFRRAIELAPSDGNAKLHAGLLRASLGQLEPAIDLTRQALSLDPLRGLSYVWLSDYLLALNRLDEAEQAVRRALDLQPTSAFRYTRLAIIEVKRGHAQAALAAAQQEPPGLGQYEAIAFARQIGSDRSAADAALRSLIEKDPNNGVAFQIASVYALRNDANETFAWLERAWSTGDSGIDQLLYDPFILRYQGDPRFAAFCRKAGLPVPGESASSKP